MAAQRASGRIRDRGAGTAVPGRRRCMHDAVAAWSGEAAGWTLNVEVLLLSARDGEVCYRRVCGVSPPTMTPHARALELSGLDGNDPAALCHSTSWRVSTPGSLVVTYVALPDP